MKQTKETQKLVDEFVLGAERIEPYKKEIKAVEATKKALQAIAVKLDPTGLKEVVLTGSKKHTVTFNPTKDDREVADMGKLLDYLSKKYTKAEVMEMISISMSTLNTVLDADEKKRFLITVHGSRNLQGYTK